MLRKLAVFGAGWLLLLACSSREEREPLSPSMQAALRALADLPLREAAQNVSDGGFDAGSSDPGTSFGDTGAGAEIVAGVGSRGPTGNGPGNGGVGAGIGPGQGGVGIGAAPSGVGNPSDLGGGGVSAGITSGAGDLAVAVCDFLNAFCVSFSKCVREDVEDIQCEFSQHQCVAFVNELTARSSEPLAVPPSGVAAMRCVSNALRNSECILTQPGNRSFEAQVRACGLPLAAPSDTADEATSEN